MTKYVIQGLNLLHTWKIYTFQMIFIAYDLFKRKMNT